GPAPTDPAVGGPASPGPASPGPASPGPASPGPAPAGLARPQRPATASAPSVTRTWPGMGARSVKPSHPCAPRARNQASPTAAPTGAAPAGTRLGGGPVFRLVRRRARPAIVTVATLVASRTWASRPKCGTALSAAILNPAESNGPSHPAGSPSRAVAHSHGVPRESRDRAALTNAYAATPPTVPATTAPTRAIVGWE